MTIVPWTLPKSFSVFGKALGLAPTCCQSTPPPRPQTHLFLLSQDVDSPILYRLMPTTVFSLLGKLLFFSSYSYLPVFISCTCKPLLHPFPPAGYDAIFNVLEASCPLWHQMLRVRCHLAFSSIKAGREGAKSRPFLQLLLLAWSWLCTRFITNNCWGEFHERVTFLYGPCLSMLGSTNLLRNGSWRFTQVFAIVT